MKISNSQIESYFPTPAGIVGKMLDAVGLEEGHTVLEPSAGCGQIAGAVRERGAQVTCIEQNSGLCDLLRLKGFEVAHQSFDEIAAPLMDFDRVVMNPPFERGQDCDHVRRAYDVEKLPSGSFKESGTGVETLMLTIRKE